MEETRRNGAFGASNPFGESCLPTPCTLTRPLALRSSLFAFPFAPRCAEHMGTRRGFSHAAPIGFLLRDGLHPHAVASTLLLSCRLPISALCPDDLQSCGVVFLLVLSATLLGETC